MEPNLMDFTGPESISDENSRCYTNRTTIPAGNEFVFEMIYISPEIDVDIQYSYRDKRTAETEIKTIHISEESEYAGTFVQFSDDSMIFNVDSDDPTTSGAFEFSDSSFIMTDISDNTFRFDEDSLIADSNMEVSYIKIPIKLYNSSIVDYFDVTIVALRGANITSLSLRRKVFMPKITWDDIGEKIYETGVSHGVLYSLVSGAYTNGVAWNGLTAVTESPDGAEPTDLWADNIKYASLLSAETFGATIEAYTYPEEFEKCDGSAEIADGVTIGQQNRETFGFCYRTEIGSDTVATQGTAYKLHLIYGCKASPSEKAYETINDSPDAITFSWEITTTPVNVTGAKPTASITIDSTKCDAGCLADLNEILYGVEEQEGQTPVAPRMPLPDEVKSIMTPTPPHP